ncbi:exodeoxyribonuclease III [Methanococcus voltae]|uniref:Exodeoxyribonuclease III Xth n=1 Tax=Methanococcus voltae (strain ATCC BAA-1334 / A3) TaxID=456320 RepID=D7DSA6_METV3
MKLISWNVNGIKAILQKGFVDFVKQENPDILCLQEIKTNSPSQILDLSEYKQYWNTASKKGYSGTAIFTKQKPKNITYGMDNFPDEEGRVITAEYDNYYLVNVYTPNSQRGLTRLDYRMKWDTKFLEYLLSLNESKPLIFCGDLNVAHKEIDLKNPKTNKKHAGFTEEERMGFDKYVENNFVDTFRLFNKESDNYTWWSYMHNARAKNIGWRIDYFCTSNSIVNYVKKSVILDKIYGSDHCPIKLELDC